MPKHPPGCLPGGCNPGAEDGKQMVRYWEIRVSGWLNFQYVCGEEMTADEAINNVPGAKPEECWAPTELTQNEYNAFTY